MMQYAGAEGKLVAELSKILAPGAGWAQYFPKYCQVYRLCAGQVVPSLILLIPYGANGGTVVLSRPTKSAFSRGDLAWVAACCVRWLQRDRWTRGGGSNQAVRMAVRQVALPSAREPRVLLGAAPRMAIGNW